MLLSLHPNSAFSVGQVLPDLPIVQIPTFLSIYISKFDLSSIPKSKLVITHWVLSGVSSGFIFPPLLPGKVTDGLTITSSSYTTFTQGSQTFENYGNYVTGGSRGSGGGGVNLIFLLGGMVGLPKPDESLSGIVHVCEYTALMVSAV